MIFCLLSMASCGGDNDDMTEVMEGEGETMVITCEMTARIYQLPDGEWSVSLENGAAPYTYLWSTGETVAQILVLDSGDYSVEVIDAEGCTASQEVTIEVSGGNPCESLDFRVEDDLSGNLRAYATGGTPPYAYMWYGLNGEILGEMETLTVTEIGEYVLAVIDSEGCATEKRLEVTSVNSDPCASLDPYVENSGDFELTLIVTGGTQPYSYTWSNGATTQVIDNLVPGVYTATVTDAIGCAAETRGEVIDPVNDPCFDFTLDVVFDETTKTLTAIVEGGTAPYIYRWSTGEDAERIAVTSGVYEVTVVDGTGCVHSMVIEVVV